MQIISAHDDADKTDTNSATSTLVPKPAASKPKIARNGADLLFRWRKAFMAARWPVAWDGPKPSNIKHVLHALSTYMKSDGSGAFPSQSRLAKDTALGKRTVERCLEAAERVGLIERREHRRVGQAWRGTEYTAVIPNYPQGVVTRDRRCRHKRQKVSSSFGE